MDDWEECELSGQQRLDALGGTFWLEEHNGWNLTKITVDAAGPNPAKQMKFASEIDAKSWVEYLITRAH